MDFLMVALVIAGGAIGFMFGYVIGREDQKRSATNERKFVEPNPRSIRSITWGKDGLVEKIIYEDGGVEVFKQGQYHSERGPAVSYCQDGKLHKEDDTWTNEPGPR